MTREEWLHAFTDAARPHFAEAGAPIDNPVRMAIGWPSKGQRSNVTGECFYSAASEDGAREIFIRPSLQSDAVEVAGVLTHELIHAALPDGEGHGKNFGRAARKLGLEGKLTATVVGDGWHLWADPILAELPPFPGAALADARSVGGTKKQSTRMLKLTCNHCGFTCRTTKKHIEAAGEGLICPIPVCDGDLTQDGGNDDDC